MKAFNVLVQQLILLVALTVDVNLTVTPSLFLYGNDVIPRNKTETSGFLRTWIDTNRLLVSGFLSRYFLYANPASNFGDVDQYSPTTTWIQIWRPNQAAPQLFTLVWERHVQLNTSNQGALYTVITAFCVLSSFLLQCLT